MAAIPHRKNSPLLRSLGRIVLMPIIGVIVYVLWIRTVESGSVPRFMLPHPSEVLDQIQTLYERGRLTEHIYWTVQAATLGLGISIALALPLGYFVARHRWISALLMPYLVAIRAVPVVAIAPIIIIRFGTDLESRVFVAAFITWFPLMEAVVVGIQSVDSHLRDLMRGYEADWWQIFWKLELPSAMPNLMSGLKIASTLAVVGAAVGEMMGGSQGLAYLIMYGRYTSNAPQVFGAVLLLTLLSLAAYSIVALLENYLLAWQNAK